jgi:cyclic pyranopterin phosphate synthase
MSNKTPVPHLTHLDEQGRAKMIDVGDKDVTERVAVASAIVSMLPETLALVLNGEAKKGDVLAVARIAGIQAAKKCSELIPLCHPLALTSIEVNFECDEANSQIYVSTKCKVVAKTGVEMEALTAASIAALTIYDMCKAVDRGMVISEIVLDSKSGGKSGDWVKLA